LLTVAFAAIVISTTAILADLEGVPVPEIPWYTVDNGGGTMVGDTIKEDIVMDSTIGQHDANPPGALHGGGFSLAPGFWHDHTPAPTTCLGDVFPPPNGDGFVDVDDLIQVILGWGSAGPGDADGNNTVDVDDLIMVILNWGVCPP
jgi:hypothetical protein